MSNDSLLFRMPSVDFCQDGLFVRVSRESESRALLLSVEDSDGQQRATFVGHMDELLAAARGITFQTGNPEGHLLIVSEGESVCLSFNLVNKGNRSCSISRREFENSLMELGVPA